MITVMSATAVLNGDITLGIMLSIQYIIGQMQGPVEQFVYFMQQSQDATLSLERLGEIHGKENEESDSVEVINRVSGKDSISLKNLQFTYGSENPNALSKGLIWKFRQERQRQ